MELYRTVIHVSTICIFCTHICTTTTVQYYIACRHTVAEVICNHLSCLKTYCVVVPIDQVYLLNKHLSYLGTPSESDLSTYCVVVPINIAK